MTGGKQMNLPITKEPKIKVSPTLKHSLWVLATQNNLSWSECMELGVTIKLAEKGLVEYPNTLFKKKYNKMRELYENLSTEETQPNAKIPNKNKKSNDPRK